MGAPATACEKALICSAPGLSAVSWILLLYWRHGSLLSYFGVIVEMLFAYCIRTALSSKSAYSIAYRKSVRSVWIFCASVKRFSSTSVIPRLAFFCSRWTKHCTF